MILNEKSLCQLVSRGIQKTYLVLPKRFELLSMVPETIILSIELRERFGTAKLRIEKGKRKRKEEKFVNDHLSLFTFLSAPL